MRRGGFEAFGLSWAVAFFTHAADIGDLIVCVRSWRTHSWLNGPPN